MNASRPLHLNEEELLVTARDDDAAAFEQLVAGYRREVTAHCYRMLGSPHDAEDAVQESLLSAWRGLAAFEGRSSLLRREGVELAFVAALQHLPGTQRAVLILREVLEYSAAEVAQILDTTPAAVNSALQRARKAVEERVPPVSQQAELAALGTDGQRELVDAFVTAWERADVDTILTLLADDVRFTMPPLPAWFDGREDVGRFLAERVFATAWRLMPIRANGQPALERLVSLHP